MAKVLPKYLSSWTTSKVKKEGVDVLPGRRVTEVARVDGKINVGLDTGEQLPCDEIVVAIGLEPSTELAKSARLEVDPNLGGIVVNAELEARTDIWAVGSSCGVMLAILALHLCFL